MAKGTWEWCPWKSVVGATAVDGCIGSISKNLEQRRFCEVLKNEAAAGSQEGAMTRGCSYLCLYLPSAPKKLMLRTKNRVGHKVQQSI